MDKVIKDLLQIFQDEIDGKLKPIDKSSLNKNQKVAFDIINDIIKKTT